MRVKGFIETVNNVIDYAIDRMVSVKGYTALFKVSIACLTFYLSSIATFGTIIYPIESESKRLLYSIEKKLDKNLTFEEFECKIEKFTYSECSMAV